MTEVANIVLQGLLLGGLYALFATGLGLIFGVMRLVNLAHGDFIVLAAFIGLSFVQLTHLSPLWSILVVVPLMAGLGYVLQSALLNRTLGSDLLPPLLVTFGLSVVLQNLLQETYSADSQRLQAGALETASIDLGPGLSAGVYPVLVFLTAVGVVGGLQALLYHSDLGRLFRATADDRETVRLMGVNQARVNALAMALALGIAGLAGVLLAIRTNFDPSIGPSRLIYAFEAVIIGGLGSLWGMLLGGMILGVAQTIGASISPGLQVLFGHLAFLLILAIRPQGLFARGRS